MERLPALPRLIRMLYQASWVLLGIIMIYRVTQHNTGTALLTILLSAIYGIYLYYHMQHPQATTHANFTVEILLILLLDRAGGQPMSVYLFSLLILRRAAAKEPRIYLETLLINLLYLGSWWLQNAQTYYVSWIYGICDVFMIGLAGVLAQFVVQLTRAFQIDRKKLHIKLKKTEESYQIATELTLRDGLTGLYNYRALQAHISRISLTRFAILLIDVDHFKDFNDQYGHIAGDQALVQIGQVILENVRRSDKVYRYGGEEFAVVLEDTDGEMAMFTAERIRVRVADQMMNCGDQVLKGVTISTGIAVFKESPMSSHQMLEQADKALYKAKSRGRNNVVFSIEANISS